jgi:YD repeat-containing protein
MKNLVYFLLLLMIPFEKITAQEAYEHPVVTYDYVKQNRIANITFVDSFSSSSSAFNYRLRSLDFGYNGLLIKSMDTYDSLSSTREMWYYYYDESNRLSTKVLRTISNDVTEAVHFQYDTLNHLIKREHKMFNADSSVTSLTFSTFTWEGDTVRIEHDHEHNSFEIMLFDRKGKSLGVYGEYRKLYTLDGRLREVTGIGSGFNESDLQKYRIKYQYNDSKQLSHIETFNDITRFNYDSNGFLTSVVEQDLKTNKMKNRTTILYKQQ